MTVTKTWNIEILLTEKDGMTLAHAVLHGRPGRLAEASGRARRNPRDPLSPLTMVAWLTDVARCVARATFAWVTMPTEALPSTTTRGRGRPQAAAPGPRQQFTGTYDRDAGQRRRSVGYRCGRPVVGWDGAPAATAGGHHPGPRPRIRPPVTRPGNPGRRLVLSARPRADR